MEAFNIKITLADQKITLTILPKEGNLFKVIYYGSILGVIGYRKQTKTWEKVDNEDKIIGDLPLYQPVNGDGRVEVAFNEENIVKIGQEIQESYIL